MCQLTLVRTDYPEVTATILTWQLYVNSNVHRDGCGIYSQDGVVRTSELAANELLQLAQPIAQDATNLPFLGHVRFASKEVKDMLGKEYAHPFSSKHYVFAHNGTLFPKNKDRDKERRELKLTDSQFFLRDLEAAYTGNVVDDVIDVYTKNFYGKFAFIIYHTVEKKWYIFRGTTATLFYTPLIINKDSAKESYGFLINTEELPILEVEYVVSNSLILQGNKYTVTYGKPVPLTAETAFELVGDEVKAIKPIKQQEEPIKRYAGNTWDGWAHKGAGAGYDDIFRREEDNKVSYPYLFRTAFEKLAPIMHESSLSLREVDEIHAMLHGVGICDTTEAMLKVLIEFLTYLGKRNTPRHIQIWKECLKIAPSAVFYEKLCYPFYMNTPKELLNAMDIIKEELK